MFVAVEDSASPRAEAASLEGVASPSSATPSREAPSPDGTFVTILHLPEVLPVDGDSVADDDTRDEREVRPLREAHVSATDSAAAPTQAESFHPLESLASLDVSSHDRVQHDGSILAAKSTIEFVFRRYESLPPVLRSILVAATLICGLIVPAFRIRPTEPLGVFLLSLCFAFLVLTGLYLVWLNSEVVAAALGNTTGEDGPDRQSDLAHCPPQCRASPSPHNPLSGRSTMREARATRVGTANRRDSPGDRRCDVVETDRAAVVDRICHRNGCSKWHLVSQLDIFIALFGLLDCCLCAMQYPAFASCNNRTLIRYLNGSDGVQRSDIPATSVNPCVSYVPTVSLFSQIGFCILLAPRLGASLSFMCLSFVFLFVPRVFLGSSPPDETSQLLLQLGLQLATAASIALVSYRSHVQYERLFVQSVSVDVALYEARCQSLELQELLESLFPHSNVLDRILKQKPVLDTVECGAVAFFEARDFLHWTTTLMPADVVNTLGYLYSLFDLAARAANVQIVKAVGDRYIACSGLLAGASDTAATAVVRHPVECVTAFAVSQLQLLVEVNFKLRSVARPMAAAAFVHCGPLGGTMLGSSRAMSYELVGQTVDLSEVLVQRVEDNHVTITMSAAAILVSVSRKYRVDPAPSVHVGTGFVGHRPLPRNSASITSPIASTGSNSATTWSAAIIAGRGSTAAPVSVDVGHVVVLSVASSSTSTTLGTDISSVPLPTGSGGGAAVQSITSYSSLHRDEPNNNNNNMSQSTPTVQQQELRYHQIATVALHKAKSTKQLLLSARAASGNDMGGDDKLLLGSYGCGIAELVNTPSFDPHPSHPNPSDHSPWTDRVAQLDAGGTPASSPAPVGERALRPFVARINPAVARAIPTLQYANSHYSAVSAILRQVPFVSSLSALLTPYEDSRVAALYQRWRIARRRSVVPAMVVLCLYTVVDQGFMIVDMLFVDQHLPTGVVLPSPYVWADTLRCSGFYLGMTSVLLSACGIVLSYALQSQRTMESLKSELELRSEATTVVPSCGTSINSLRELDVELASTLRHHRCELALIAVVQILTFVSLAMYPRRLVNNCPVFVGLQMFVVLFLFTISFAEMMALVLLLAGVFLLCHFVILTDDGERRWLLVLVYVACAFFVAASRERLEKLRFDLISLHEGIAECHDQERALRQAFFDALLPPCLQSRKATAIIRRQRVVAHGHMEAIAARKKRSIVELLQLNVVPPLRLHFHELFVLLVRFDAPHSRHLSLEVTASWQQDCVQLVDDVVYDTWTSRAALGASVSDPLACVSPAAARVYMLGNVLVYAGPTVPSSRPSRLSVTGSSDRQELPVAEAADTLLAAAHALVRSRLAFGGVLSSILCCGSSFATVLGSQGLTASLVGMVAREGVGLMAAAPTGFHGVSARAHSRIQQLSEAFPASRLSLPVGPPQRWRIRGCGTVNVHPIGPELPGRVRSRETLASENGSVSPLSGVLR